MAKTVTTMPESQPSVNDRREDTRQPGDFSSVTLPKRELLEFIHVVCSVLGADMASVLTELWLDELASMDRTPEPTSPEWRLVTLGASARLVSRLLEMHCQEALF
jgi:hypothetical protein